MTVHEMTGTPHDPDCLHCVLPQHIDLFARAHPHTTGIELVNDVARVCGELIASVCALYPNAADGILKDANRLMTKHAREALAMINNPRGRG